MQSWMVLGLGCAFGTAVADVLTRRSARHRSHHEAMLLRTLVPALLLLPLLAWSGLPRIDLETLPWLAAALPLEVLALNLYLDAIRSGAFAQTLPFLALTPVASVGAAWLLLGEGVAPMGAAGVVLVGAGCYFASRIDAPLVEEAPAGKVSTGDHSGRHAHRRAMWQMACVAVIYALTPVLAKGAMRESSAAAFGIAYYSAVAALSAAVILVRDPRAWRVAGAMRRMDWVIGICIAAVVLMHYAALQSSIVPYFLALKRMSIAFGAVMAMFVLREWMGKSSLLPSALVVSGTALIVLR